LTRRRVRSLVQNSIPGDTEGPVVKSNLTPLLCGKKLSHFFTFFSFQTRKVEKSGWFSSFKKLEKKYASFILLLLSSYFFNTEDTEKHKTTTTQGMTTPMSSKYSPSTIILIDQSKMADPENSFSADDDVDDDVDNDVDDDKIVEENLRDGLTNQSFSS
jgi:hypothetical protein